jgi:hypothetical protein
MGCDIHSFLEYESCGEWHLYGEVHSGRNYAFFGLLSEVRGEGPAHFELISNDAAERDFAETMSPEIRDSWRQGVGDWHSLSVGGIEQLEALRETAETLDKETLGYVLQRVDLWLKVLRSVQKQMGVEDVRVVAWYDN